MNLATLISPEAINCVETISSKKRALECLAELLSDVNPQLNRDSVFDAMMERERLGTTALGKGVAIPHCRLAEMEKASIALVKVDAGIDYDAPDGLPVDVLVALVVPEDSTEEHLQILAKLAELLSDSQFLAHLRGKRENQAVFDYILEASKTDADDKVDPQSDLSAQQAAN